MPRVIEVPTDEERAATRREDALRIHADQLAPGAAPARLDELIGLARAEADRANARLALLEGLKGEDWRNVLLACGVPVVVSKSIFCSVSSGYLWEAADREAAARVVAKLGVDNPVSLLAPFQPGTQIPPQLPR